MKPHFQCLLGQRVSPGEEMRDGFLDAALGVWGLGIWGSDHSGANGGPFVSMMKALGWGVV